MNKDAIIISKDWKNQGRRINTKKFIIRQKEIKKDKPIFRRRIKKTSVKKNEEKFESFALKIDRKVSKDELLSKFNL